MEGFGLVGRGMPARRWLSPLWVVELAFDLAIDADAPRAGGGRPDPGPARPSLIEA